MNKKRWKLGIVIDALHELYQAGIWQGIVDSASKQNIDLITFIGTSQDGSAHFGTMYDDRMDTHYELISDFAVHSDIDGVLLFSSPIADYCGHSYVQELCKRFAGKPLVCISEEVDGYSCVIVENGVGIEETIDHLVNVHNLRNIAFVKGPADHREAQARFEAYKRGLETNHLTFRPELVLEGGFIAKFGKAAVQELIARKVEFDGVVAVNDYSAFGVMEQLAQEGILVPMDVAVTGFDDVDEATKVTPSLATVKQPLFELGEAAVHTMMTLLFAHNGTPVKVMLPTKPVSRRSCGCFSEKVQNAKAIHEQISGLTMEEVVAHLFASARKHVNDASTGYPGDDKFRDMLDNLVGSLVWDIQRPNIRHIFLNEVDMLLYRSEQFSDAEDLMHAVLRDLTVYVASLFDNPEQLGEANNLLQQAGTFVREQLAGRQKAQTLHAYELQHRVGITNQRIVSSFNKERLLDSILVGFPALGMQSASVVLFEEPLPADAWRYPAKSVVCLAYDVQSDGSVNKVFDKEIHTADFFPTHLVPERPSLNHIFMPMHFENRYVGYVVYEHSVDAPSFMYEELRTHLSAAIEGCRLVSAATPSLLSN